MRVTLNLAKCFGGSLRPVHVYLPVTGDLVMNQEQVKGHFPSSVSYCLSLFPTSRIST